MRVDGGFQCGCCARVWTTNARAVAVRLTSDVTVFENVTRRRGSFIHDGMTGTWRRGVIPLDMIGGQPDDLAGVLTGLSSRCVRA